MEADLERWRASIEEAANPRDFLIVEPDFRDVLRGTFNYVVGAVMYWTLGEIGSPWTLRQKIGFANRDRQLGPARVKECEEWLKEELDFFEDVDCYDA